MNRPESSAENAVKVSVIMPVYKVEKFVGKAIESIQKQTLQDWEFLIVDDGSPDESGAICDRYAEADARLRVIHKENGGAPSARNVAMEQARGRYFYFMDSDDWAEPAMLEEMVRLAEANEAQLVVAGYYIDTYYTDDEYVTLDVTQPDQIFTSRQAFRENAYRLFDHNLLYTPWNKLYLAEYIREFRFPQTLWDDFPFNLRVIRDIERVCVTSRQYYHFMRARAESETAKYVASLYEKREEEHGWLLDLYAYWDIHDEKSVEFLSRRYAERIVGCIENLTNPQCTLSKAERRRKVREIISTPTMRECLAHARPRSRMMRLLLWPIRRRWVSVILWQGALISRVKRKHVKRFAVLKASR